MTVFSTNQSKVRQEHLVALYELMLSNKDNNNAKKIIDLYEKEQKKEFVIGFSGHFSAGKSSMINALLGKEILPKSPIPTSANIVKITSGEGVARIYFHHEEPIEYDEPYDLDTIKEYCKNKDTISKVELSTSEKILPERCAIFDTPGIDAADETDRLITESSLHLIDIMFYVVDYNHVQSEVNLNFLRKIQKLKIPYFLIINQIDKHNENEISFSSFEKKIKQTFDQWKIHPKNLFFTSLLDQSNRHNQFIELKKKIFLFLNKDNHTLTLDDSTYNIIDNHKNFLEQTFEEEIMEKGLTNDFNVKDKTRLEELNEEIQLIKNKPKQITNVFRKNINQSLKNAYLMPASLRDKAYFFLEAQQKDFKIGFFSSKKKTRIEKEKRTQVFFNGLQESIEANLQWKLRDKLLQLIKEHGLEDEILRQHIQQLQIDYTEKDLCNLTKQGAKLNGDYVLNYTNDVSADILQKYKSKINVLLEEVHDLSEQKYNKQLKKHKRERQQLQQSFYNKKQMNELDHILQEKLMNLYQQLEQPQISQEKIEKMDELIGKRNHSIKKVTSLHKVLGDSRPKTKKINRVKTRRENLSVGKSIQSIDKTIQTVENLPGLTSIIEELNEKKKRLTNREFTVVLFGAFSAGKSSFANALMGERLLPTSPNPTTAVINRITPPTLEYNHGSVFIQMKNEETLVNDLKSIMKSIPDSDIKDIADFSGLIEWIKKHDIQSNERIKKEYQSFLKALLDGYETNSRQIGGNVKITLKDFAAYVTDETKACYIEEVTLFYDSALTREGITLVDTPGADSINARHTNVAFDYIKYADAILYVTYYNHALSRSDKDFLGQLGRVKETFELDKMFFIINAADLASNDKELDLVKDYVEEQLVGLGIRFPQIYALSSKLALKEHLNHDVNQQMEIFKKHFLNFINQDLAEIIIKSAIFEINRAKQTLANYIETSNLDMKEKEVFRISLLQKQETIENMIEDYTFKIYTERLEQKIEKQLYYVEERLSIRFHDMFKEIFNPTSINETGKRARKQIEQCMVELLDYVGYELLQELRAVSLRIEAFLRELGQEANNDIHLAAEEIEEKLTLSNLRHIDWKTPAFQQAFSDVDINVFKKDLAIFKGTKLFFEKNEKNKMKEAIYDTLVPFIKDYTKDAQSQMNKVYLSQWDKMVEDRKQVLVNDISSYVENNLSMIEPEMHITDLENKYRVLKYILVEYNEKEEN